jgi:hypothetical protein
MTTAERLLRLYPRAWRDRYGEEFLATVGPGPLHPQRFLDIVSGAIDSWLSADVRAVTAPNGGRPMTLKSVLACESTRMRYTARDGVIAAVVMIVATVIFKAIGTAATQSGRPALGATILNAAFLEAFVLSMPFWVTKGQPWKAQAVIVGGSAVLITAIFAL